MPIRDFGEPPPAFKRDLDKYLLRSIRWAIGETDARIIVIDNISYLAGSRGGPTRLMKTLKLWTMHGGLSILAITHLRATRASSPPYAVADRHRNTGGIMTPERGVAALRGWGGSFRSNARPRPMSLADIAPPIAQNADTIFAIARSTMSREVRYLKHLKSNNLPATLDGPTVATFRIERMESGKLKMKNADPAGTRAPLPASAAGGDPTSATEITESTESRATGNNFLASTHSPFTIHNSPFIGFSFLGLSPEESHLIDYAAGPASTLRTRGRPAKPRTVAASAEYGILEGIIDGSCTRYLKGE